MFNDIISHFFLKASLADSTRRINFEGFCGGGINFIISTAANNTDCVHQTTLRTSPSQVLGSKLPLPSMSESKHHMTVLGQTVSYTEAGVLLVLAMLFTYRLFFRSRVSLGPTSRHMDASLPGDITKLATEWGEIYIRVFDPVKGGHLTSAEMKAAAAAPIVCLPGINAKLVSTVHLLQL